MKINSFVALFIILVVSTAVAQDVWQRTNGPYSGTFNIMTLNNEGHIYGGMKYLYRSTDNGDSWHRYGNELGDNAHIYTITFNDSNHIFLGTDKGVYCSLDGGESWELLNNGLQQPIHVYSILILNDNEILIGTYVHGIYRSIDYGESWTTFNEGLVFDHITVKVLAISVDGKILAGSDIDGIYYLSSPQNTWENYGLENFDVWVLHFDVAGNLYAGTDGNGMYRLQNDAELWEELNIGIPNLRIKSICSDKTGNLYAGVENLNIDAYKIFKSTDKGDTWIKVSKNIPYDRIKCLIANPSGHILASSETTVYRSIDSGRNWKNVSKGLGYGSTNCIAVNNLNDIFVATRSLGLYRSTDNGFSWEAINDGIAQLSGITSIAINEEGDIFISTTKGIFRSFDNGEHWELADSSMYGKNVTDIIIDNFGNLFSGLITPYVYKSENNGKSWSKQNEISFGTHLAFLYPDEFGNLYAGATLNPFPGGYDGALFKSVDEGRTWNRLLRIGPIAFEETQIHDCIINSTGTIFIASKWWFDGTRRSRDGGNTWEIITNGLGSTLSSLALNSEDHLYAGSMINGVYSTLDNGDNWIEFNQGLDNKSKVYLAFDQDNYLYAGTDGGVFRSINPTITGISDNNNDIPSRFSLSQNCPNPFNPSTNIKFTLPKAEFVKVDIFNITGQKIETLLNQNMKVGIHELEFSGQNLSSGIYIYRIEAGEFQDVKKMILIR